MKVIVVLAIVLLALAIVVVGMSYVSMENRRLDVEKENLKFRIGQQQWENQQQIRRGMEEEKRRTEAKREELDKMVMEQGDKLRADHLAMYEKNQKDRKELMLFAIKNGLIFPEPNTPEPNIP